jgi:hypothetical protein
MNKPIVNNTLMLQNVCIVMSLITIVDFVYFFTGSIIRLDEEPCFEVFWLIAGVHCLWVLFNFVLLYCVHTTAGIMNRDVSNAGTIVLFVTFLLDTVLIAYSGSRFRAQCVDETAASVAQIVVYVLNGIYLVLSMVMWSMVYYKERCRINYQSPNDRYYVRSDGPVMFAEPVLNASVVMIEAGPESKPEPEPEAEYIPELRPLSDLLSHPSELLFFQSPGFV